MDTRTGEVRNLTDDEAKLLACIDVDPEMRPKLVRERGRGDLSVPHMVLVDTANLGPRARAQLERTGRTKVSRNSPCPCGSRKRFKRCCMTA